MADYHALFDDTNQPHRLVVARLLKAGQSPEQIAKATGLSIGRVRLLIQELRASTG